MMLGSRVCGGLPIKENLYAGWRFRQPELNEAGVDNSFVPLAPAGINRAASPATTVLVFENNHNRSVNDVVAVSGLTGAGSNANGIHPITEIVDAGRWRYDSGTTGGFNTGGSPVKIGDFRNGKYKFQDISGNGRDTLLNDAAKAIYPSSSFVNGRTALETLPDGSPAGINRPNCVIDNGSFGSLAQPFTITVIMNHTAVAAGVFIMDYDNATSIFGEIFGLGFMSAGGANYTPGSIGPSGKKVITGVYNGSSSKFFLNGSQVGATGNAGTNPIESVLIGCNARGQNPSDALMEEVLIHSGELSASQILAIANYGLNLMGA